MPTALAFRQSLTQEVATTGWPPLGPTATEPGAWKGGRKDSPERSPMREPILKVLLICDYRFSDQQIAACGATKVGCREQSRNNGGPSSGAATTPCP